MQTFTECINCFQRQIEKLAVMAAGEDIFLQTRLISECQKIIEQTDPQKPPPELAARVYARAAAICGQNDFFAQYKHKANTRVMRLLPKLQERIQASSDPLLTALRFSLIANYIDVGVEEDFDWESALVQEEVQEEIGGYSELRSLLDAGQAKVMIL